MRPRKALAARLARLEAAMGGDGVGAWLLVVPADVARDPAALAAALGEHRQRTGYAGRVVVGLPEAASVEAWAAEFGPAAGRA